MTSTHERKNSISGEKKIDSTNLTERSNSFHTNVVRWPASLPISDQMAEAGFYFTPTEKNSDCVTCYRCSIKMFNWLPDDVPKAEHKKFSPSCKEVKSWKDVILVDEQRIVNRAEQTDSSIRSKLAGKAKRFTDSLHRKHEIKYESPSHVKQEGSERVLNDEEKYASIKRQREVAEKALDGLQKLASFYPPSSSEQKRAEQSIVLQTAELEKLREEENKLAASMGNLTFGRGWNTAASPKDGRNDSIFSDEESSPITRSRSQTRPLPVLPSQQRKNSLPRMPARLQKSQVDELSSSDDIETPLEQAPEPPTSDSQSDSNEWIEYFTEAGVPYYYSTITKATVWEIPSSKPVA